MIEILEKEYPIVPISAENSINIDSLIQIMETQIKTPTRDIKKNPKMFIMRSFDVNKPGTKIEYLKGGILGGSLIHGKLKIEDEIEIKGLVVENVKTPFGKEFYDIFYQKYNQSGTKYSFVIDVNEKPFIGGRGALISIDVGDDKIFEFQARPDEDLLKNAADHALKLIDNYSKNRNTFEKMY